MNETERELLRLIYSEVCATRAALSELRETISDRLESLGLERV